MWATHSTLELVLNPHLHIIRTRRRERINEKRFEKARHREWHKGTDWMSEWDWKKISRKRAKKCKQL
jgi:hypothetical protein